MLTPTRPAATNGIINVVLSYNVFVQNPPKQESSKIDDLDGVKSKPYLNLVVVESPLKRFVFNLLINNLNRQLIITVETDARKIARLIIELSQSID